MHKARIGLDVLREWHWVRRNHWRTVQSDLAGALAEIRRAAGRRPRARPVDAETAQREGREIGYAVERVMRFLPGESRCLMRSLVVTAMLSRRGIPSSLVIAVRPGPSFIAHAWVEHGGQPLLPPLRHVVDRLVEL